MRHPTKAEAQPNRVHFLEDQLKEVIKQLQDLQRSHYVCMTIQDAMIDHFDIEDEIRMVIATKQREAANAPAEETPKEETPNNGTATEIPKP